MYLDLYSQPQESTDALFEHCHETKRHLQRPPLSAVRSSKRKNNPTAIKPTMLAKGGSGERRKKCTSPIFSDLTFRAQGRKLKLKNHTPNYNQLKLELKINQINNSNLNLKGRNLDLNNQLYSNSVPVLPTRKANSP